MQQIGEGAFSEVELAVAGDSPDEQVAKASEAFNHFVGAPLGEGIAKVLSSSSLASTSIAVRIAGGKVSKLGVVCEGLTLDAVKDLCAAAKATFDDKLERIINTMSAEGIARVEYGRAGEGSGVDVYVEPTEPAKKPAPGEAPASSAAN
jgi:hypothetical protein